MTTGMTGYRVTVKAAAAVSATPCRPHCLKLAGTGKAGEPTLVLHCQVCGKRYAMDLQSNTIEPLQ